MSAFFNYYDIVSEGDPSKIYASRIIALIKNTARFELYFVCYWILYFKIISVNYVFGETFCTEHAVAYVDYLAATSIIMIVLTIRAVAFYKGIFSAVEIKILRSFDICFFLCKSAVFTLALCLANAVFIDSDYTCRAMTAVAIFAIMSSTFYSRHNNLLCF